MEKRVVRISYTARIKDGKIFDTTDEEVAKKENIFNERRVYSAVPIVVGEKQVIQGLDEALKDMKTGEEKEIEISPEKAYGQRNPNLIRLVPMKVFKQHKINPIPGMPIELDGKVARIQTVAGGRVRVDFNPELAGKTLVYNVKIEEESKTDEDRIKYLIERSFNTCDGFELKINDGNLDISIPENSYRDRSILVRKASFAAEAFRFMNIEKITFSETWEKKEKEERKEEQKEESKEDREQTPP